MSPSCDTHAMPYLLAGTVSNALTCPDVHVVDFVALERAVDADPGEEGQVSRETVVVTLHLPHQAVVVVWTVHTRDRAYNRVCRLFRLDKLHIARRTQ